MQPGTCDFPGPPAGPLCTCSSPVCVKAGCRLLRSKLCKAVVLHQKLPSVSHGAEHGQDRPCRAVLLASRREAQEPLPSSHSQRKTVQLSCAALANDHPSCPYL